MRLQFLPPLSFFLLVAAVAAQGPPAPSAVAAGPNEVVVDFVARDGRGHPVRDLRPEEVKIADGGAPIKIARLRLGGGEGEPRLVSFIFDAMNPYNAPAARKSAAGMLGSLAGTGALFSVWRMSDRLELLQPFTKDNASIAKAIETAAAPVRSPAAGSTVAPAARLLPASDPLTTNAQGTLARWDRVQRDEKLRAPLSGLVALARQQASLKGRKAIVYFSDGAQVETCTPEQLRSVIGSASRAGVVLYTLNVGGLSESAEKKASSILDSNAPATDGQANAAAAPAAKPASNLGFTFIQLDADAGPRIPLKDMAEQTGGLYIKRSSEMGAAVGKIVDDLTTYYRAYYTPPQHDPNGQFRAWAVKVSRPQTRVQSPGGYFAFPPEMGPDTAPFVVPLLRALDMPDRAQTIPFRIDVMHLGPAAGKVRGEAVLELPLDGIVCKADPALGLCDMHFSVIARIKSADGQVVKEFSQDVPDQMASEGLDTARANVYTLQRGFVLPPGEYRLEGAVLDRQSNKLSTQATSFTLAVPQDLAVCDMFLVRSVEPADTKSDTDDPLYYQDGRLVPLLIPVWRGADRDIQVFFLVSPDAKVATAPRAIVEVERDKKLIERPAIKVLERRPGAPVPVTAMLKRSLLDPGHYQLVAKLTQGKATVERRINFEVVTKPAPPISEKALAAAAQGAQVTGVASLLDVKLVEGAQPPEEAELKRILSVARERAADYHSALPDFVCTRTTTKATKRKDNWSPGLATTDLLQFVEGAEKTQTLTTKQVANVPAIMKKVELAGELGGVLALVFNPDHAAQIEWKGIADLNGARVHVFEYQVARKNSGYLLSLGDTGSQVLAAYRGLVLIDASSLAIRRVVVQAVDLPKNFPIQESAISVDYDFVRIGGKRYLVPQHSTWVYLETSSRQPMRTERVFQGYRKYTTTSGIKYMGEATNP